tara:strand:+ start:2523 stop:4220 length:1698 start_codon:yes stop_codon:yes gene_type:complete
MFFKFLIILLVLTFGLTGAASAQTDDEKCRSTSHSYDSDCIVIFHTRNGEIAIEFFPDDAPNHIINFLHLTESGFYDNTVFHRVIKDFMIQGGDPSSKDAATFYPGKWGGGGPGYTIPAEFNSIKHDRGVVSMARSDHPDSAGSQFFIVHKNSNHLDGKYTVFGRLATQESFDTLDYIANLPCCHPSSNTPLAFSETTIDKTEIVSKSEIKNLLEFGEPNRTGPKPTSTTHAETYRNTILDFKINAPQGWLIEESPTPDNVGDRIVTLFGSMKDGVAPSIYVNAAGYKKINFDTNEFTKSTFEETISDRMDIYYTLQDSGLLEIISEDTALINNHQAYQIVGTQYDVILGQQLEVKFRQTLIEGQSFLYGITYTNLSKNFYDEIESYENTLVSFTILSEEQKELKLEEFEENRAKTVLEVGVLPGDEAKYQEMESEEKAGGGCLIATAAFGSEMAPQVQFLREIRDNTILQTESGTSFMAGFNQFYYSFSPVIADYERENQTFKEVVKLALTPLLTSLTLLQFADIDSESEMLGYGIGIILLNIGMYFVVPAVLIMRVRSFYKLQ